VRNLEQASARLQLTDEQKQKVQALASDVATKTQALNEEALKQLKTILSDEQFQQFQQMQPRPGDPAFGGGIRQDGRGGPAVILERLRTALGQLELTDDQKTKLKPVLESFDKKMQELRAGAQGGGGRGGPELREKFRTNLQELRAELQTILTPEQIEKIRGVLQVGDGGGRFGGPQGPGAQGQRPGAGQRPGPGGAGQPGRQRRPNQQ
jgi:Spy/CpxP family protein refolding chaperone